MSTADRGVNLSTHIEVNDECTRVPACGRCEERKLLAAPKMDRRRNVDTGRLRRAVTLEGTLPYAFRRVSTRRADGEMCRIAEAKGARRVRAPGEELPIRCECGEVVVTEHHRNDALML
jgi:hypothetical protein